MPSEFVRGMYVADGVAPERVFAIPNGVDLTVFSPGDRDRHTQVQPTRFLFVGGLIWRKGPDVLLEAFKRAFPERDDVELVIKDFGAEGIYRGGAREPFHEHAASGALPRLSLISDELSSDELAELYRSCDVLVHPYRGEGFGMPVLEAMACGLPVIATGGGPTDEFCPPDAGWRIRSTRTTISAELLDPFTPAATPWVLEPELEHLVAAAAGSARPTQRRGARADAPPAPLQSACRGTRSRHGTASASAR